MSNSNSAGKPVARRVAPTDEAELTKFFDGLVSAFRSTALTMTFISEKDDTPPPYPSPLIDLDRVRDHIAPKVIASALEGAELLEAGNFSAVAVWETPAYKGKPFSEAATQTGPLLLEWRTKVRQSKEKFLGLVPAHGVASDEIKPHYHLGFLARNPDVPIIPGSIAAVLQPYVWRAQNENVPVWLEATYDKAVRVYEHFGFRVVEKIVIGRGKRNADGWPEEGGEGVSGICMILDSHLK